VAGLCLHEGQLEEPFAGGPDDGQSVVVDNTRRIRGEFLESSTAADVYSRAFSFNQRSAQILSTRLAIN
jgi:hypothetical protein